MDTKATAKKISGYQSTMGTLAIDNYLVTLVSINKGRGNIALTN